MADPLIAIVTAALIALFRWLVEVAQMPNSSHDFGKVILPRLVARGTQENGPLWIRLTARERAPCTVTTEAATR